MNSAPDLFTQQVLPLFEGPSPPIKYVRGSDTSRAAAESIEPSAASMRGRILNLIRYAENGLTCDEAEQITGMRHQTVSARIRELFESGHIVFLSDEPNGKRQTRSGRMARVYVFRLRSA